MKCIKNIKTGEVQRVDDKTAYNTVGISWSYISKSEWKLLNSKKLKEEKVSEEVVVEKKPYKKGETPQNKKMKNEKYIKKG